MWRGIVAICFSSFAAGFSPINYAQRSAPRTPSLVLHFSKGFAAAGGFGKKKEAKPISKKALLKRIEKKYGGSSPQDIARGTERYIGKQMNKLPDHMQVAAQLYKQLRQWDSQLDAMSLLEQTKIPQADVDGANRARQELERLCGENSYTLEELHNMFQRITWDASADAKAAKSIVGKMSPAIETRINKASSTNDGRCLDVGCGFGTIVPNLLSAGLEPTQIYGVDLSSEMIRNAVDLHPKCTFEAAEFLLYQGPAGGFDSIIFCSTLHDLPDQGAALRKASELLRPQGSIVIVHAQGAGHVAKQVHSNPVLVRRGLPNEEELRDLAGNLGLSLAKIPAIPNSAQDDEEGYLAVLQSSEV